MNSLLSSWIGFELGRQVAVPLVRVAETRPKSDSFKPFRESPGHGADPVQLGDKVRPEMLRSTWNGTFNLKCCIQPQMLHWAIRLFRIYSIQSALFSLQECIVKQQQSYRSFKFIAVVSGKLCFAFRSWQNHCMFNQCPNKLLHTKAFSSFISKRSGLNLPKDSCSRFFEKSTDLALVLLSSRKRQTSFRSSSESSLYKSNWWGWYQKKHCWKFSLPANHFVSDAKNSSNFQFWWIYTYTTVIRPLKFLCWQ